MVGHLEMCKPTVLTAVPVVPSAVAEFIPDDEFVGATLVTVQVVSP
jgi:hypothetical protein